MRMDKDTATATMGHGLESISFLIHYITKGLPPMQSVGVLTALSSLINHIQRPRIMRNILPPLIREQHLQNSSSVLSSSSFLSLASELLTLGGFLTPSWSASSFVVTIFST